MQVGIVNWVGQRTGLCSEQFLRLYPKGNSLSIIPHQRIARLVIFKLCSMESQVSVELPPTLVGT